MFLARENSPANEIERHCAYACLYLLTNIYNDVPSNISQQFNL